MRTLSRRVRRAALASALVALAYHSLPSVWAADPALAPEAAGASAPSISVEGRSGRVAVEMAAPSLERASVPLMVEHGARQAQFEGPLLWSVLSASKEVEASRPSEHVRQTVTVTGEDGYTVILAVGEISPEFEGKPVILADRMDGRPIGLGHIRLVVPNEHRAGRSVRDVVRITIGPASGGSQ